MPTTLEAVNTIPQQSAYPQAAEALPAASAEKHEKNIEETTEKIREQPSSEAQTRGRRLMFEEEQEEKRNDTEKKG
ncbi:unnamed protein product [Strongylus vulgaris]|uniref:Uncharacterized protein n=1 Tax=Strongylus vulgaris TaxID=40348 RepID=A0A3P7INH6_STRVU|nr:unnamed protein product [Strongylus vulgaris]